MKADPDFCDLCDVRMDLHPNPEDQADPGCDAAEAKARVLESWGRWT